MPIKKGHLPKMLQIRRDTELDRQLAGLGEMLGSPEYPASKTAVVRAALKCLERELSTARTTTTRGR